MDQDKYLKELLIKRDKSLGIGGNYSVCLEMQTTPTQGEIILSIPNLTKESSRKLFDLIDENHIIKDNRSYRITLWEGEDKKIDENILPNAHTEKVFF